MASVLSNVIEIESQVAEQLASLEKQYSSSQKEHLQARDKLFKRRQELVSGKATPTSEELAGYVPAGDGSHGAAASAKAGVPYFWLNALCNQDTLAEEISSRDRQALAYCTSVKAVYPAAEGPPTIEMSFSSNPFFSSNTLRRCLGDAESGAKAVTTDIQWKDSSHNLTIKEVRKGGGKGKKGGKGKGGSDAAASSSSSVRLKPCPSFFRFFLPDSSSRGGKVPQHLHDPTALQDEEEEEEEDEAEAEGGAKSAKADRDELLMALLTEQVLPRAAELYLAGPLQTLSDEEEGDFQVVHAGAGSPADLPGPVQGLLAALRHNQAALDALAAQRQQQRDGVNAQEDKLRLELAGKRRELLVPAGSSSTSVPRFWLRVLRSADAAALAISSRDAAALASLADVRFSLSSSSSAAEIVASRELLGKLELEFLPNPHLAASCSRLVKEYTFEVAPGGEPYLLHSKVAAAPAWASAALDPTHKPGRDGKQRPASSFFQLFRQGGGKYAFNLAGDDKEVQAEANELEVELLMELHGRLLLRAGSAYSEAAAQGWADDDSEAGDKAAWQAAGAAESEEEEEEGEGSDDEGEAAHRAAARRAKAKDKGGFKLTKASVLIGFVVLMLLAELFVFLDMAGLFKSKR
ncbi:hypothetical protein OEZ85_010346 [Tetradesmus obliquus]|uniref:Nucleosome assembly protein n=1 Tax=Tetradesmus obliquus TaxID=3088 RepID=A0ABY8TLZ4_TETOB|nr:hypothetical protein OEZ85_010346 [Tetradesmus obliquus]